VSPSSVTGPSKSILKRRSQPELPSSERETLGNRAAQAIEAERRRELEANELSELVKRHPLTPKHILLRRIRNGRKASIDLPTVLQDSPESSVSRRNPTSSQNIHIHFNERVERCIGVDVDESDYKGLFIISSRHVPKLQRLTIKLPATTLRPSVERIRDPPHADLNLGGLSGSYNHFREPSRFYDEGESATSASTPHFPTYKHSLDDEEDFLELQFDDLFAPQFPENEDSGNSSTHSSTTTSPRQSSDIDLEESEIRASKFAIPIPAAKASLSPDRMGSAGEEDDDVIGIIELAFDAISTAKDLAGILWNAGWSGRRSVKR
jgi:hypothetical protein